jgi:hypothetical protein
MSPNSGIGRRLASGMRAGRVVRLRLVVVREQQHAVGAVADVGDVERHVGAISRCTEA